MEIRFSKQEFRSFISASNLETFTFDEKKYKLEFSNDEYLNEETVTFFKDYYLFDWQGRYFEIRSPALIRKYAPIFKIPKTTNLYPIMRKRIKFLSQEEPCPKCGSNKLAFVLPERSFLMNTPLISIGLQCSHCSHFNFREFGKCECKYCLEEKNAIKQKYVEGLYKFYLITKKQFENGSEKFDSNFSTTETWNSICKARETIIDIRRFNSDFTYNVLPSIRDFLISGVLVIRELDLDYLSKVLEERSKIVVGNLELNRLENMLNWAGVHYFPAVLLFCLQFSEDVIKKSYEELIEYPLPKVTREYRDEDFIEFAIKVGNVHNVDLSSMSEATKENILELLSSYSELEVFYAIKQGIHSAANHSKERNLTRDHVKNTMISFLNKAKVFYNNGNKIFKAIDRWELEENWGINIYTDFEKANIEFLQKNKDLKTLKESLDLVLKN